MHKNVCTDACPNFGLTKVFPKTLYVSNRAFHRTELRIPKSQDDPDELDDDSTDNFKSNIAR